MSEPEDTTKRCKAVLRWGVIGIPCQDFFCNDHPLFDYVELNCILADGHEGPCAVIPPAPAEGER